MGRSVIQSASLTTPPFAPRMLIKLGLALIYVVCCHYVLQLLAFVYVAVSFGIFV